MKRSIFSMMAWENLTTFKIRYNYKTKTFRLLGAKEWEDNFDFSGYNKDFIIDDILTDQLVFFNTGQMRMIFAYYEMESYLKQIENLMAQGNHFGMDFYYGKKTAAGTSK